MHRRMLAAMVALTLLAAPVMMVPLHHAAADDDGLADIIAAVDRDELYRYDKTIQDVGPHPTGSDECRQVASFIYGEFMSYGLNVSYHAWEDGGLSSRNVVATLPGETNNTVIISAHYDSVDDSPGADDDGSGVSSVLMAAKVLSSYSFRHTVKFICFSGEEQGLYGSGVYAREAYQRNETILADVQLDGVGHAVSAEGGSTIRLCANDASTWITDAAQQVLDGHGDRIGLSIHRNRNFPGSDHQSFINYGYEGVFFLEYEFNPYYHSPGDTIDHVNFSYLTKVCKLATATVASIADREVSLYTRIVEPERGAVYAGDAKLMALGGYRTVVLGHTHVRVDVQGTETVERVTFYLDGEIRGVDETPPYEHEYSKVALFNHDVEVEVQGTDSVDLAQVPVVMFNLVPGGWLD
ncbi:MAG: M28 family peptidase [Candidatus Thermoplasmatota archaeon]|nr:M28 family peptidase [Candidatus Thermoplasmatota archaeon]